MKKINNSSYKTWEESGLLFGLSSSHSKELSKLLYKADEAITILIKKRPDANEKLTKLRFIFPLLRRLYSKASGLEESRMSNNINQYQKLKRKLFSRLNDEKTIEDLANMVYEFYDILKSGQENCDKFKLAVDWDAEILSFIGNSYFAALYYELNESVTTYKDNIIITKPVFMIDK